MSIFSGDQSYDAQCTPETSRGLGWFTALYFFVFILVSVMTLMSLFVGVVIASMESLKDSIKEEKLVWIKVHKLQKKYDYGNSSITVLLELFDLIDTNSNGKLKVKSLHDH